MNNNKYFKMVVVVMFFNVGIVMIQSHASMNAGSSATGSYSSGIGIKSAYSTNGMQDSQYPTTKSMYGDQSMNPQYRYQNQHGNEQYRGYQPKYGEQPMNAQYPYITDEQSMSKKDEYRSGNGYKISTGSMSNPYRYDQSNR